MEELIILTEAKLKALKMDFSRYLLPEIDWEDRLICVRGARGTGKTTLLLQRLKQSGLAPGKALYTTLDHLYFSSNNLLDLAINFEKCGGTHLFLDEVHKYPGWSREIKNIYDDYPNLKVAFTGSSILEIFKAEADLSRRAIAYDLTGLSFREFLEIDLIKKFPVFTLDEIVKNHIEIAGKITEQIRPLEHFNNYLRYGNYPYFLENRKNFLTRLLNTVNQSIENDMPAIHQMEYASVLAIKKLLYIISMSVPFKPNIAALATRIGCSRNTVLLHLDFLEKARLIHNLRVPSKTLSYLAKPDKILMDNTNLMYAIASSQITKGTERETFFINQVSSRHRVHYPEYGDFLVDEKLIFEVGGKGKNYDQLKGVKNSYIAADDLEIGFGNKIPLWLFGFLY